MKKFTKKFIGTGGEKKGQGRKSNNNREKGSKECHPLPVARCAKTVFLLSIFCKSTISEFVPRLAHTKGQVEIKER